MDNNSNEMYCTNCNNKLSQGNTFCSYCGNIITNNIELNVNKDILFNKSNISDENNSQMTNINNNVSTNVISDIHSKETKNDTFLKEEKITKNINTYEPSNNYKNIIGLIFGILLSFLSIKLAIFDITKIMSIAIIYVFILKLFLRNNNSKINKTFLIAIVIGLILTASWLIFGILILGTLILFTYYSSFTISLILIALTFILILTFNKNIKNKLRKNDEIVYFLVTLTCLVCIITILNKILLIYFI